MGRTANIIIKDVIHVFVSISKIMRILLMGRRNWERWRSPIYHDIVISIAMRTVERKSDFKLTTDTPYLALTGELWAVHCEELGENCMFRMVFSRWSSLTFQCSATLGWSPGGGDIRRLGTYLACTPARSRTGAAISTGNLVSFFQHTLFAVTRVAFHWLVLSLLMLEAYWANTMPVDALAPWVAWASSGMALTV